MDKHELEVNSILKNYGHNQVLSNVYLKCQTGEILGILGRNGCGKSTLLKIIFGTENTYDKSIRIDNIVYDKPFLVDNLIAYLPQDSFLPKGISLRRITFIFISNKQGRSKIFRNSRISKHLDKHITELSGGELRYFEILLLVNLQSKFILLDEPFSGIEPLYKKAVKDLIKKFRFEKGFIITDHDYRNIIETSDNIILLKDGRCIPIKQIEELEQLNYLPAGTLISPDKAEEKEEVILRFKTDQQTLNDLDLLDRDKNDSVFSIFDNVETKGGMEVLDRMLKCPVQNISLLESRRDSIRYFRESGMELLMDRKQIDFVEYYITSSITISKNNKVDSLIASVKNNYKASNDYYIIKTGIEKTVAFLDYLSSLLNKFLSENLPDHLSKMFYDLEEAIGSKEIRYVHESFNKRSEVLNLGEYDFTFRKSAKGKILRLLNFFYELEVYFSIAVVSNRFNLGYAEYSSASESNLNIVGLFHPLLKDPVANNIRMDQSNNLCFLTGANMSGKSTFLKTFGICVYLAHLGFPVPAKSMKTTIFNGLITTINLPDNINKGYSHYYNEVRRVKDTALEIKRNNKIIVIFDELFRGTNVKDAAAGSLMVTSGFSAIKSSLFLVSTHIVEIAEELKSHENILYKCFNTKLQGDVPIYDYKLNNGVSTESLGLVILKNEKVLEILQEASKTKK